MIIPAILETNWEEIEKKLEICREFSKVIHIDFIDGKFTNNKTFLEFEPFKKYSDHFILEAHLMTEDLVNYLDLLYASGFKRFLGHIEKMSDQVEFVAKGESLGAVGLAIDIETPVENIKVPLDDLDQILLMSVMAGASGRSFDQRVLQKIKKLKDKGFNNIELDGGINTQTLPISKQAGANSFCVTSFLFRENPEEQFRILESLLEKDGRR